MRLNEIEQLKFQALSDRIEVGEGCNVHGQVVASRLTKMANNKGANFVPWGIPPWGDTGDDNDFPTLTLWDLLDMLHFPSDLLNPVLYIP